MIDEFMLQRGEEVQSDENQKSIAEQLVQLLGEGLTLMAKIVIRVLRVFMLWPSHGRGYFYSCVSDLAIRADT